MYVNVTCISELEKFSLLNYLMDKIIVGYILSIIIKPILYNYRDLRINIFNSHLLENSCFPTLA